MAHKAEEGQKLAGSAFLAEISLKHHPNLGQNVSKIQERHSPSEFSVSEEELDLWLGHAEGRMVFLLALVHVCYFFMQETSGIRIPDEGLAAQVHERKRETTCHAW